jgi:hypothetical protein
MDTKPSNAPKPRPLGNESTDPFSPTYPPGSLHEVLRQEEGDASGDAGPVLDDPDAHKEKPDAPKEKKEGDAGK